MFRNYQSALRAAGFNTVYECETVQCNKDNAQQKMSFWVNKAQWVGGERADYSLIRAFQGKPFFNYLHVRKRGPKGDIDVQVAVRTGDHNEKFATGRVMQFVQIVEAAQVEQGKVTIDAAAIGLALQREGKIALYGVHFDTNRTEIKPESDPALVEMAGALKSNPALNVFVIGHTDNVGHLDANLVL